MSETRAHYGITFAVLAAAAMAYGLLQSLVLPALPTFERVLHSSPSTVAWLLTAYLLSASVATPIVGRLGDIHGKEKMLCGVLVAMTLGSLLSAVATSISVMIIGRVIQGIGGAVFPLAFGIIRDEFPPERVATGIGLISAVLGVGAGAGIVLAGPIVEHLSYHWLYWIPLLMAGSAAVATFVGVPESPVRAPGGVNWLGGALMSAWLVALLVAVSEGPAWGWRDARVLALFAGAAILFAVWIRAELVAKTPLVDMRMMRIPSVWTTNAASLLFGFGMFAAFVLIPQFVQTPSRAGYGFGASPTESGLFLIPIVVTMVIAGALAGPLSAAVGSKPPLAAGGVFSGGAFAMLTVAHGHPYQIYVAMGVLGVGVGLAFAAMTNLVVEAVRPDETGIATGMNTNIRNIGGALGASITTSIVISHLLPSHLPEEQGYTNAFAVCAIILAGAVLAALAVPGRTRLLAPPPASPSPLK